jgi:hypothetical protein
MILLVCRTNLWAASGRYRAAEIPPNTVAAIPRSELTLPCISRHINEIVGSMSQIRTLALKSFTSSVGRQWALAITAVITQRIGSTAGTLPRTGIAAGTTAKTRIEIGTRELDASGRDPTPDRRSHSRDKRGGDSRDKNDGPDTRDRRRESSPHPARDRSNNCECTQFDDDYSNVCAFLDAAPVANEADRADDRLLSASIPHHSRNPRTPNLHVDFLPYTGAWSADYINEATAAWLRSVGIKRKDCSITVCSGIGTPQQFCVPCRGSYILLI